MAKISIKKKAEQIYIDVLERMIKILGNTTTYNTDLQKIGKKLFKHKFVGVFSSDNIPHLKKNELCILNLDKSYQTGSHWVGMVMDEKYNVWIYDSFARDINTILPDLKKQYNSIKTTEQDAEQKISQNNCGARTMAFLYVFHKCGVRYAKYI